MTDQPLHQLTMTVRHANSCFFTMVAVGDDGKPQAVKAFVPRTPVEERRHDAATLRRKLRQELDARFKAIARDAAAGRGATLPGG